MEGAYDELENIILNGSSGPCSLPLEYLRRITDNFSDGRLLGEGGFGKVYKGVLQNGNVVAVKRLDQLLKPGVQERQFENEVYHLMRLKHPNIVQFLGYCYETRNECVEHDGKYIFAEMQQKLICLEYLPNGSLDRHLSDGSSGLEWHTRYKMIKGICCGLLYLHEECQCQFGASIIHLDLKPGNILLDEYMGPKIADFGLSRLFEDNKTQIATFLSGSLGYMAPEYLIRRIVTAKADIYNLGVIIIEIITGRKVDILSFNSPTSWQQEFVDDFVNDVIGNWRNRLGGAPSGTDCKQIMHCLEIGLGCIKFNREERPTSREIMESLDRWEATNCNVNNEKRPPVDQILTHVEEKPSASTTGYGSIHFALQPNVTVVRSTAAEDSNSNTNTGNGPRSYGSPNRSRVGGFFHRQLSGVMRCLSGVMRCLSSACLSMSLSLSREGNNNDDDEWVEGVIRRKEVKKRCRVAYDDRLHPKAESEFQSEVKKHYHFHESEFQSEVAFLSRLRHNHLVGFVGCCAENKELLLVWEYMKNGALYDHLHPKAEPSESSPSSLVMSSWKVRIRMLLHASRGIDYLHSSTIIHGDVKSSNILLDECWNAVVSDFGLSKLMEGDESHMLESTVKAARMVGYMDPEYNSLHHLTQKSDVYGFGVVMLEVLTGKPAILEESDGEGESPMSVVDYAVPSIISGELGKVLDPRVPEPTAHEAEALGLVAFIAAHCVQLKGKDRPGMEGIVANLQTALDLCEGSFDGDHHAHSSGLRSLVS